MQNDIRQKLDLVDPGRLRQHIEVLTANGPRSIKHPKAQKRAFSYIESQLLDYGVNTAREQLVTSEVKNPSVPPSVNLIAEIRGRDQPAQIFEVAAHYDTVETSPGADDNASGVAALLEIARVLSEVPLKRTVRLCFFTQEESGLNGSRQHVANIVERGDRLDGAIVFEMIGYTSDGARSQRSPARVPFLFWPPRTGNFIAVVGNFRSGAIGNRFENTLSRYVPDLRFFSANRLGGLFRDAMRSDHKPYWEQGYRAIMLTDTANFRNPNYHGAGDTADTLDYAFLTRVTRASLATVLGWSEAVRDQPSH